MRNLKRIIAFVIVFAIVITTTVPLTAIVANAQTIYSGQCGDRAFWELDISTGTLTISGQGGIYDYLSSYSNNSAPWFSVGRGLVENVIVSQGITRIGEYNFCDCYNLKSLSISNTVESIGEAAFRGCSSLETVEIPSSVNMIEDYAFFECSKLSRVELHDGLKEIYGLSFCRTDISSIYIPQTVIKMSPASNFDGCDKLASVEVAPNNDYYSSEEGVVFDKEKTVLYYCPMAKTGTYQIPYGVQKIESYAFYGSQLLEIDLPTTLKEIQEYAFGCEKLTQLVIPNGVETISSCAFPIARKLEYIYIPATAKFADPPHITGFYFSDCLNLQTLEVDENNLYYTSCDKVLYNKDKTTVIHVLPSKKGVFNIPEGVEELGDDCFKFCPEITAVNIPSTLKRLNSTYWQNMNNPFEGCQSYYVIGDHIERFYSVFAEINVSEQNETFSSENGVLFNKEKSLLIAYPQGKKLSEYTVPDGVVTVGRHAFSCIDKLRTITLPSSVSYIERFAIYYAQGLNSIIIMNSLCSIEYTNESNQAYTAYANRNRATIYGYKNSTAEEYAHKAGLEFVDINKADDYYATVGSYGISVIGENWLGITDYTISFNGQSVTSDSTLTYVDIPDDYNGNIEISKDGYISIVRSAKDLNKNNIFKLYSDSYTKPIIQQFDMYNKTYGGAPTDLAYYYHEYIYDLEAPKYDIYLDVNYNGNDIVAMYLQQGKNKISLVNGNNTNIILNSSFNSGGGTIYFCMLKSDGTIYKIDSKIVALPTRQQLEFAQTGNMSTEIDESIDGIGGFGVDIKLPVPNLPISIKINSDGSFKGTVGINSKNYNATYYEQISETIKKISTKTAGKEDVDLYSTTEMAKLEKYIKESGGDIICSGANVGIDVDMKFIGCIEGALSEKGGLKTFDISLIASISGSVSYTQQSAVLIGVVPIPYYWTVAAEAELAAALEIALKEGNDDAYFDLPTANLPEITAKVTLSGELCAGVNKIIGGGARLSGAITLKLPGLGKDLDESVVTLNIDFEVVGQIAGFEGSWTPFGDHIVDYQIYPEADVQQLQFALKTKSLARNYLNSVSTLNLEAYNDSQFKTNTYTYTNPQVAQLSNGNLVMVWMDDVVERSDINRTALFYSIYNYWSGQWSKPKEINNDGTADFSPVMKKLGDDIYVVWNNVNTVFNDTASFEDVVKGTEICVAKFNGTAFENTISITNNQYMDVVSSLNNLNGIPTITWIANSKSDITGQTGNNSIYISELIDGEWNNKLIAENLRSINSAVAVYEDNETVVYYSMDVDNSVLTANDIEIFRCANQITEQITNNSINDTYLVSTDSNVYWNSGGCITDGQNSYNCKGLYSDFQIVSDGENDIALYSTFDGSGYSSIYAVNCDVSSESIAFDCYDIYGTIGDFAAVYDSEIGEIVLVTNEIYDCVANLALNILCQYPLYLSDAYYNELTLISGGKLSAYIDISNNSLEKYDGYTLYAYANDVMLLKKEYSDTIKSGETISRNVLIPLPTNIDFDEINIYIVPNGNLLNLEEISGLLFLNLYDISLEHPLIVSETGQDKFQVSVVNRGMKELRNAKVELRKNSVDGEIIKEVTINSILPNEEEIIAFDFYTVISEDDFYYVTTNVIENENKISNNSVFALKATQEIPEETIIKNIVEEYVQLESGIPKVVSNTAENIFVFIPTESGLYAFESSDNDFDTYGYILDASMNELATDDDRGEGNNFKVEYNLTAGEIYFLKSKSLFPNASGAYYIKVTRLVPATSLEILNGDSLNGFIGETYSLATKFSPDNAITEGITWSSSNTNIAIVDEDGSVHFVAKGTAVITATSDNGLTDSIAVNVAVIPQVRLDETYTISINEGGQVKMFTFTPTETKTYTFTFENASDVYVSIIDEEWNQNSFWLWTPYDYVFNCELITGKTYKINTNFSFEDKTGNYTFKISESAEIAKLEIISTPDKMEYFKGLEEFSYYGLKIRATLGDGTTVDWDYFNSDTKIAGYGIEVDDVYSGDIYDKTEISCGGKTVSFKFNVKENPVQHIEINTAPTREYVYGDIEYGYLYSDGEYEFYPTDLTGLSFTVYYIDGKSEVFTYDDIFDGNIDGFNYELYYDGYNPKPGNFPVVFEYMGKTDDYTVVLKESTVASIAVTKKPNKTEYINDYTPDFIGMEVTITYTDGTTKAVTLTEENLAYEYTPWWGELCYKVEVDGHTLTIEPYYGEDMYYVAYYLSSRCEIKDITFTESKEIKSVELDKVSWNGDGMTVKITYTDETTETLTLDIADFFDFEDSSVAGFGKTENGLLYYYIETYTNEDGNIEKYEVSILGKGITIEAERVIFGDLDVDGNVNTGDLASLKLYLAGIYTPTDLGLRNADINSDGVIGTGDLADLKLYLAGVKALN